MSARARIILDLPSDASRESAQEAAAIAVDFAASYTNRRHGLDNLVVYLCEHTARKWVAYWTKARSVVVREVNSGEAGAEGEGGG